METGSTWLCARSTARGPIGSIRWADTERECRQIVPAARAGRRQPAMNSAANQKSYCRSSYPPRWGCQRSDALRSAGSDLRVSLGMYALGHHEQRFPMDRQCPRAVALARHGAAPIRRCPCAGSGVGLGFSEAARTRARSTRDRRALGPGRGRTHTRRLGSPRNGSPPYLLPSAGRRPPRTVAPRWQWLVLRMEGAGVLLESGRRRTSLGACRLELPPSLAWRRATCRLCGLLCPPSRLPCGWIEGTSPGWRLLRGLDHPRPGGALQGRTR